MVRALVTLALDPGTGTHPSSAVVPVAQRTLADAFAQLPQVRHAQNDFQCRQRHDRHDRDGAQRLQKFSEPHAFTRVLLLWPGQSSSNMFL